MHFRTGVILVYLLLGCILMEDALPYFAQANQMECFEYKADGSKDGKKQKDFEEEFKLFHEKFGFDALLSGIETESKVLVSPLSERIPDSAHLTIFAPPPNQA